MKCLTETPQCLAEILFLARGAARTASIEATIVDAASEAEAKIAGACSPVAALIGDVVLHAGIGIDLELARVHGASEPLVILSGILIVGIAKRVVDVLFGTVDSEALFGDLKFLCRITVGKEREHPDLGVDVRMVALPAHKGFCHLQESGW